MKGRLHWLIQRAILEAGFRLVLPLAARLPFFAGERCAARLGRLNAARDLDWRTVAVRIQHVAERSATAMVMLSPGLSANTVRECVKERFVTSSREEWEAHLIMAGRAPFAECVFEGLESLQAYAETHTGVVLLTAHFDSVMMGLVQLGLAGIKLHVTSSSIVEDARVPPVVRRYFKAKYRAMERHLNGGRILHFETHLKHFYAAVKNGESIVLLSDAPAASWDKALPIRFGGAVRAFVPGAVRVAESLKAPMAAFVCLHESPGRYRVVVSPVQHPEPGEYLAVAQDLYSFLESYIKTHPGRWWAADLLPGFLTRDA
ncbi:MAG: LpxL/LpxP family acyltransferase [Burkholderiales bacterium]